MILLVALSLPPLAHARSGRLRSDGTWIRDGRGRVVLLRGANYSGLEFGNFFGSAHPPEEADFEQMASWGVNVVRLPIAWHYLEPQPNVIDLGYLRAQVDPIVRFAHRHGIVLVLEMHQFQWSPCTGGNGVPAWSCEGLGYTLDISGAWAAQHDFWAGQLAPDGRPLLDHFFDVWQAVARYYRRRHVVAGFDFLNEPLDVQHLDAFEAKTLYPVYRRWDALLQKVRAEQMRVLEPPVTRNLGVAAKPEPLGSNAVYAPHLYTETGGLPTIAYDGDRAKTDADYALAESEGSAYGAVVWIGEYGGNTDGAGGFRDATELAIRHQLDAEDAHALGGAVWAYFPTDNTFSLVDVTGAEKGGLVDAFSRPYPQSTAGIPVALHYDPDTREMTYTFAEDPSQRIPDPTVVFVPFARHYPSGVTVETTPGDRAAIDVAHSRIVLRRNHATPLHTIRLRPQ